MPQQEYYIHQLIDNLRTKLLTMGAKAQQALDDACQSVLTRDLARASSVMDGDVDIDNLENEIDAASRTFWPAPSRWPRTCVSS